MAKITIQNDKILECKSGENLLRVLQRNGIFVAAECGGNGTCGKCKVLIGPDEVLACQTIVKEDLEIDLPGEFYSGLEESFKRPYDIEKQVGFGIALDLGTTTIAAYLLNLDTGVEMDRVSVLNAQAAYGADVVTRIQKCGEGLLEELHGAVTNQINGIIKDFKNNYELKEINRMVVSGNTVMLHLLANVDPTPMGFAPYDPVFLDSKKLNGIKIGIEIPEVTLLPSISGYLGSDLTAGILACNLMEQKGNALLVDLGTNGEIILKTNSGIYGVSTAAGPAFEGAKIECGLGGVPGAVSKVSYDEGIFIAETIEGRRMQGICGSGLIDLIALLVREGLIDGSGAFDESFQGGLSNFLKEGKFWLNENIWLSQKDIREFQLAKSAVVSGIETLVETVGLNLSDIDTVFLAGGFGFYVNKENASRLGLIPRALEHKIICVGNSSGLGAKMALSNPKYLLECETIAKQVTVVELANNKLFTKHFIENMDFEE